MNDKKQKEILKSFLNENVIIIVDKGHASKSRLSKTLVEFGARQENVKLFSDFEPALQAYNDYSARLILCDYFIVGGSGFDLFREIRKSENGREAINILITSNLSQAAVARAAEEDVDSFILKPYTVNILLENLAQTVAEKLIPSDYLQKINEGRKFLESGNVEQAEAIFSEAKKLNEKPALAHYYNGFSQYIGKHLNEARDEYNEGLTHNQIHFKCLKGLFDVHMGQGEIERAYMVAKNLVKYFPLNQERLMISIRLAIQTKSYDDLSGFYDVFLANEEKSDKVINHICAGMYVVGKYFLKNNQKEKAMDLFKKVGLSFGGYYKFIRSTIEILVDCDCDIEASDFFKLYKPEMSKDPGYQVSEYLIKTLTLQNDQIIALGVELIENKYHSLVVYKKVIKAAHLLGNKEYVDKYLRQAKAIFVDKVEELDNYMEELDNMGQPAPVPTLNPVAA
ncbi:MAG: response regulator [Bacteriovoracaceae bacterium]|nr:response regulator [Bacteriovoracaceae bacterium]